MAKTINPSKVWFKTLREAQQAQAERAARTYTVDGIYRQKQGRHKGQYFVGSYIDFINRY